MTKPSVDIFKTSKDTPLSKTTENVSYIDDYENFLDDFRNKEVSGEEVGEMIARMSQHFSRHNLVLIRAMRVYSKIKVSMLSQTEGVTGKMISATKAGTLAAASDEASAYEEARAHVQNLEQSINALKALQKGIIFEYQHQ